MDDVRFFMPVVIAAVVVVVVVIGIPLLLMRAMKQFIANAVEMGIEQSWLGREARRRAASARVPEKAPKNATATMPANLKGP